MTKRWFARLVDQAVVVPSPTTDRIGAAARAAGAYVVLGVDEREPHGTTIYNTILYFGPDGQLARQAPQADAHRLGADGVGHGRRLDAERRADRRSAGSAASSAGRTTCRWPASTSTRRACEVWLAPTLARGDGWIATMRHIAREGRVLGGRREPVCARRPDPGRLPGPRPRLET